jgi:hypothetical protein
MKKLMFLVMTFAYSCSADTYVEYTKELIKYELDFDYSIKDPMVNMDYLKEKEEAKKSKKVEEEQKLKDKKKILESKPITTNIKPEKKDIIFNLISVFNKKAFINSKLDDNSSTKWYKKGDMIFNYNISKVEKNYVVISDENISKIITIKNNNNKNLRVIK